MWIRLLLLVTLMSGARAMVAGEAAAAPGVEPGLPQLAGWMTGSFSSALQAAADSEYFDIRLRMTPIWGGRTDGPWLYVEQAVATSLDKPYRQRVYHLVEPSPGRYVSEVFELPGDPLRFAGAWKCDSLLAGLTPEALELRQGCGVHLRWNAEQQAYEGRTPGEGCLSTLKGAAYATSEVRIGADGLVSWDRGWDEHGLQVWGAVQGGYQFRRAPSLGGGACCPGGKKK